MSTLYARQAANFRNELKQSCAALVGIAQGLLADGVLNDSEIKFLSDWLVNTESVSLIWPGSSIHQLIREILEDGRVSEDERAHLLEVLQKLIGGTLDDLADSRKVSELPLDRVTEIDFANRTFCLSGDFVFGPKKTCEQAILRRAGMVSTHVTKALDYLVIGGLGSPEWKHGSFGTKVEKAVQYKANGVPLLIVHEDVWANSL